VSSFVCALALFLTQETPAEFPKTPLLQAVEEAKARDRLILAEFWTLKSEPSRSYATTTLGAAPVLAWLGANGVGARVNLEFNKKICTQLGVVEAPTLLVLDAGLARWARIEGAKRPEEIVAELDAARAARKAFKDAEAVLATAPDDANALRTRTDGLIRGENAVEAEKTLRRLAALEAGKAGREDLALRIGMVYYAQRRDKDATRILLEAADWARSGNKDARPPAVVTLAAIELRANRPDRAVEALELLLKEQDRFPDRSKALFMLGETYLNKLKDRAKAKEALRTLVENHADRFSEAGKTLLRYIELQEKGIIATDDAPQEDAK
jgi:tetratricopeptide (TPR) repeat protein